MTYVYDGSKREYDVAGHKFTGQERDTESGLDNFGARYNSSSMGRFMSPDPTFLKPHRLVNPQRWNMYAYGVNNPLRYVDPDGQDAIMVVYPNYRAEAGGRRYPTGHGAMIVVDKNGKTTYREYGGWPGLKISVGIAMRIAQSISVQQFWER